MKTLINTKDLAKLLGLTVGSVHQYASRAPERLPPRMRLPGRRLQWDRDVVMAWLEDHAAPDTK